MALAEMGQKVPIVEFAHKSFRRNDNNLSLHGVGSPAPMHFFIRQLTLFIDHSILILHLA